LDVHIYQETNESDILPWQYFTRDFWSNDLPVDNLIENVLQLNKNEMLDLRPYIIENPITVFVNDPLIKLVDLFRKMHLRHMIVINPSNGKLCGIITRQDLFMYLDL
jgi:CBS domain-containing protein